MPKSILLFQEFSAFLERLNKHHHDLSETSKKLVEIISQDSIVKIAARIEIYDQRIRQLLIQTEVAQGQIDMILKSLQSDGEWVSDDDLDPMLVSQKDLLCAGILKIEHHSIEMIYRTNDFISKFIKK
jgi:hypothetical protein